MATVFESTRFGNISLKNRTVHSATWNGMADDDGYSTREIDALVEDLAYGEVGLIITGHAYVHPDGKVSARQLGVYSDRHIEGLSRMVETVHNAGGKIVLQLSHAGCHSEPLMTGVESMGPSIMINEKVPYCRAMTEQEVNRLVSDFTYGAIRAKEAGFDGIQLHGAHGYLISQFLSPFYNRRHDRYGGSINNRARIVVEIIENIQQEIGKDYPVMIKINSEDFVEGGLTVGEMLEMVAIFENLGITAIELSGGLIRYSGNNGPARKGVLKTGEEEVYYLDAASSYKRCCTVPLMLVGGIRSYNVAERLIKEGITDYVSFSRPLIREPHLIKQWKAGDTGKASCISCNSCLNAARQEGKLYCVVQSKQAN